MISVQKAHQSVVKSFPVDKNGIRQFSVLTMFYTLDAAGYKYVTIDSLGIEKLRWLQRECQDDWARVENRIYFTNSDTAAIFRLTFADANA